MSSIYSWNQSEATLTGSTTTVVLPSDSMLIFSATDGRMRQTTLGTVSGSAITSTSSSTGTNLPASGGSVLTAASSAAFVLSDPTAKGIIKEIYMTSSTSTALLVTVASTAVTVIISSGNAAATSVTLQGSGQGYVQLTSISTTQWWLTAKQGTVATS